MAIYIGNGDDGSTSDAAGRGASKACASMAVLGDLDELASFVGMAISACGERDEPVAAALSPIRGELLAIGATISAGNSASSADEAVARMEQNIDAAWSEAGELTQFVLPGGCELAARLHVARSVCRRTERTVVAWADCAGGDQAPVLKYLNRLSDLLFAAARLANHRSGQGDALWRGER